MRAAVLREIGKPLEIEEIPDPRAGDHELVLRVRSCGICGSDLHWSELGLGVAPGAVMGHEFAGEVVEKGRAVGEAFALGDRVCALPFIGCGRCAACRSDRATECPELVTTGLGGPGAYAEYVRVGVPQTLRLPDAVSDHQGAIVEPLAVGLHAVRQAALPPGARVLVVGAGPIGLAVSAWARLLGARAVVVSEMAPARRELAGRFGATDAVDPSREEVMPRFEALAGGVPDAIFECVGVRGLIQQCLEMAPRRGRVVVVGVCMEPDTILPFVGVTKELSLQFVVAYERRDFELAIAMIAERRLASAEMVTDVVDLAGLPEAFQALKRPTTQCKVIVEP